jgi:Uma2 family endonuclease
MSAIVAAEPRFRNVAELLHYLGDIPPERVRMHPAPGHATDEDALKFSEVHNIHCELIFATLVEKPMSSSAGFFTAQMIIMLGIFSKAAGNLGHFYTPDTLIRFSEDTLRMPDISFYKWERYPEGKRPSLPIMNIAPNLTVEVLSPGNTRKEMAQKQKEYFEAGVELMWIVDIEKRTVLIYTSLGDQGLLLQESDTLTGSDVLPGFSITLQELFACLDEEAP